MLYLHEAVQLPNGYKDDIGVLEEEISKAYLWDSEKYEHVFS